MSEKYLVGLAAILVLGAGAQWLAWRVRLPSILLLLLIGFIAGPVSGWLKPDELFGDLLFPIVSLSVAIILFEGGLTLRFAELRQTGKAVRNLVTVGCMVTWVLAAMGAHWILDLSWGLSWLLGAILTVSGPTVVMPLLRHIRPSGKVGPILKWEAILIDPIGATLAVLVFELLLARMEGGVLLSMLVLGKTVLIGGVMGILAAGLVVLLVRTHRVPDFLENMMVLAIVTVAFVVSNHLQAESGLLSVTVMGISLANQRMIRIREILTFKENLRVLLISSLFILLAGRLRLDYLTEVSWRSLLFVGFLILLVRPVSVWISTAGAGLKKSEKLFLSWVMPRGIVAAAVSSVFAQYLVNHGNLKEAGELVPLTFVVIVGTVAVYGLTSSWLARRLGLSHPNPQGVLLLGAGPLNREIASALQGESFKVLLVDSNYDNIRAARMKDLKATFANILSDYAIYDLDLSGIGRLLAMTTNDEVNSLAVMHFIDVFGRSELYQFSAKESGTARQTVSGDLRGRVLFGTGMTFSSLSERFEAGATVKKSQLTESYTFEAFRARYRDRAVPLFLVTESKNLMVFTAESKRVPKPGETILSLVNPEKPDDGHGREQESGNGQADSQAA